ncbi:SDR family oxidoreductase [Sphingomonas sp. I4]
MSHQSRFADKVVIVTGASTGIGRATAIAFAREGARVVIGDFDDAAADTASAIIDAGGSAMFVKTDVSQDASIQGLVQAAIDTHGRLDIGFNNAGLLPRTADLADMSVEDFDRTIAVDLRGVFLCMKYQIAQMLRNGGGAIVNTASVAGLVADPGMAPMSPPNMVWWGSRRRPPSTMRPATSASMPSHRASSRPR